MERKWMHIPGKGLTKANKEISSSALSERFVLGVGNGEKDGRENSYRGRGILETNLLRILS